MVSFAAIFAVNHLEVIPRHDEQSQSCHQSVKHGGRLDFLQHGVGSAADDLVPVHLNDAVHACVVSIVNARILVVEGLKLQVVLGSPRTLLGSQPCSQFRLHLEGALHYLLVAELSALGVAGGDVAARLANLGQHLGRHPALELAGLGELRREHQ